MAKKYGLSKAERLKSVVRTEKLFTEGKSFWIFPFSVHFRFSGAEGCKFLVSVGKHYFRHAVDRNRVKRLVREAYRKNKEILYAAAAEKGLYLDFAFVYKSRSFFSYAEVEASVKEGLSVLAAKVRGAGL